MNIIYNIYQDLKKNKNLTDPFKLAIDRQHSTINLFINEELSTTLTEHPQSHYQVHLDNDWGDFSGETLKKEKEILKDIARSMQKHVNHYKDIPIEVIVEYADTAEIPNYKNEETEEETEDEFRMDTLKMAYVEHFELTQKPEHEDIKDWNRGTLFGIRYATKLLGYKIDFKSWEEDVKNTSTKD